MIIAYGYHIFSDSIFLSSFLQKFCFFKCLGQEPLIFWVTEQKNSSWFSANQFSGSIILYSADVIINKCNNFQYKYCFHVTLESDSIINHTNYAELKVMYKGLQNNRKYLKMILSIWTDKQHVLVLLAEAKRLWIRFPMTMDFFN